jgi:hypothetical protein
MAVVRRRALQTFFEARLSVHGQRMRSKHFSEYHCIAKNEKGISFISNKRGEHHGFADRSDRATAECTAYSRNEYGHLLVSKADETCRTLENIGRGCPNARSASKAQRRGDRSAPTLSGGECPMIHVIYPMGSLDRPHGNPTPTPWGASTDPMEAYADPMESLDRPRGSLHRPHGSLHRPHEGPRPTPWGAPTDPMRSSDRPHEELRPTP